MVWSLSRFFRYETNSGCNVPARHCDVQVWSIDAVGLAWRVPLGIDSLSTGGKMAPLKVELSMLRGMAGRYGQCADAVADLDTTQATQHLMESLPETDTGRFAVEVGKRVDAAFDATGNRIHSMAGACRSAADNYERTDQALVEKLTEKGVL